MGKEKHGTKEGKKQPVLTHKEKKVAKQVKKREKTHPHPLITVRQRDGAHLPCHLGDAGRRHGTHQAVLVVRLGDVPALAELAGKSAACSARGEHRRG